MTCAVHVAVAVVKLALICSCVGLKDVGVLSYVPPFVTSRSRTIAPVTKLLPVTVSVWFPLIPGTGFGLTLLTVGVTALAVTVTVLLSLALPPVPVHVTVYVVVALGTKT